MKNNLLAIKRIFVQITTILTEKQKKNAIIVCISMIMVSLLELLSISMIYPFLSVMMDAEAMRNTWYIAWVYKIDPNIRLENVILILGVNIIIVFVVKNITILYFSYLQHKFTAQFSAEASTLMLSSYMKRPYEYFINHNSADLLRGVSTDVGATHTELLSIFQFIGETLTVLMLAVYLFITSWEIALGAMILALFCLLGIVFGFKARIKKAGKLYREAHASMNKYSLQAIHGIKEITVSNKRDNFVRQYSISAKKLAKTSLTYNFIGACPERLIEGVCMSGFIGIVCIRILMGVDIKSFIPVLGAFAMGAFKILPSISKISNRINTIIFYQPGLQHCYDNITEARNLEEKMRVLQTEHIGVDTDTRFKNELSVNNITWKYTASEKDVLKELSLIIHKGESVAFIGASGSGKTTLADIILGLFKPQEGNIMMDGVDIHSIPHIWSKVISFVPQSVYLVDDTIRANIAFGIEAEKISDDKIWQSLEQAQMAEFVRTLPQGLDTIVGERGVRFSGGQKQRIAIARALYDDPDILVLDEATSALDTETETAVMEAIDALHGQKTLIIVAHRLTTIKNCDKVYEIVNGVAIETKMEIN